VQGQSPDLETQLAGKVGEWVELLELRGEVHGDGGVDGGRVYRRIWAEG
jgi:hypothetical protein